MHFMVCVITENKWDVDDALSFFDENMGVRPYVDVSLEDVKSTLAMYDIDSSFGDNLDSETKETLYEVSKKLFEVKSAKEIIEYNNKVGYFDELNEHGEHESTYNPCSKWDWYTIGGRWDGLIENNRCTVKELKDSFIDFSKEDEKELIKKYKDDYNKYLEYEKEKTLRNRGEKSIKFSEYLDLHKNFSAYAVLTYDSRWYDSRWHDKTDNWSEDFKNLINECPDDYYVTVVDCHI